ncbi:hypothetical protein J4H92_09840 [Leucobacter weissii]|uniref:HEPN AbiJ-N-terminal domain-containing protein n=1 Tax=Leucobacter weissii TaxID=1983706 RepID=A0A939S8M0_9MICO|nr:hypothetical protein [Leucobacter weissii]MBO1902246.1 hypothetical protein [Leucobacter weissii]
MASFAERMGLRETRTLIQSNSLDEETRVDLWNVLVILREIFEQQLDRYHDSGPTHRDLLTSLWMNHFKQPRDDEPHPSTLWLKIKEEVLTGEWFDVLDLFERVVKALGRTDEQRGETNSAPFADALNDRFEHYLVGYRFIGKEVTPIDSNAEAESVSAAIEDADAIAGARHSLERAVELLADRTNPDYPNSIKESISAVEAVTKKITGETTLGAGLKKREAKRLLIHPALKEAWLKIYGWTSDESGVRRGAIEAASVDQTMAKYMLVSCSAFVSYLIEEGRKAQLI